MTTPSATGTSHEVWIRINNRYGPLSQICLKLVVTDDPEITRWLLVAFLGYEHGSAFDLLRMQPATLNIISGRDSRNYGLSNVAKSFTGRPVAAIEPIVNQDPRFCLEFIMIDGLYLVLNKDTWEVTPESTSTVFPSTNKIKLSIHRIL
ncbi:putative pisatin demethylase protein [Eutypa lata UCREL1]|uniref:Putative pisatin demethylase protein n=1 Tax=Eutypa lata (strain UCR-EL1) TaxID=1287681 RepID=M7T0V5_EUTLA|nr:putative pisatin demethylase protein [Eutypa lata UCREL1]